MKRLLTAALTATLLIVSCHAWAEYVDFEPLPELRQALREAGRETENILEGECTCFKRIVFVKQRRNGSLDLR